MLALEIYFSGFLMCGMLGYLFRYDKRYMEFLNNVIDDTRADLKEEIPVSNRYILKVGLLLASFFSWLSVMILVFNYLVFYLLDNVD